jgi:predicted DNA-binding transcriptional regulator YafY
MVGSSAANRWIETPAFVSQYNPRVDRTERFYKIQQLIHRQKVVPARRFRDELEISPATFKRDLEYLRSRLNIPIVWDREANGYRYDPEAQVQELPGLWFSAQEIYALLTMKQLLENLEPGLLGRISIPS